MLNNCLCGRACWHFCRKQLMLWLSTKRNIYLNLQCPKKHSYDCPVFKATGTCSQGSKCKLHHPKTEKRGKKRKRPTKQNSRGRYFGSTNADITKSKPLVVENSVQSNGGVCFQGKFDDYISLDFSDGEEGNINDLTRTVSSDVETTDLQLQDSDEYVKPLLLMKVWRWSELGTCRMG